MATKKKGSAGGGPRKTKHLPTKPSPSSSKPRQIVVRSDCGEVIDCMSSEHFGQLAWQFKRMSGSSGLKVQAAIAC